MLNHNDTLAVHEESDYIDEDLETTKLISHQIDKLASQVVWPNNVECSTNSYDD